MRYFSFLSEEERQNIFFSPPEEINRDGDKALLAHALGATLYMPANKKDIANSIIRKKNAGIVSMVLCLEDAIGDNAVEMAQNHVAVEITKLCEAVKNGEIQYQDIPFLFLRVRTPKQISLIAHMLGECLSILTGFVFPKFCPRNGAEYFEELKKLNAKSGKIFYGMPILESKEVIYKELREQALSEISQILNHYHDLVLNIRIGATDFCSQFGIRRSYGMTIYDITVLRDCITDILNAFTRIDQDYVVSGPVWEYFDSGDRVLKPQLRQSPFQRTYGAEGIELREALLSKYLDGLIREVLMDKANGLVGKTIIHPSHIIPVQALQVVSHEEYMDASSIIYHNKGEIGVIKSQYQNKMNEIKPHLSWAQKILTKSKIYGVFHEKQNFTSLFRKTTYL